MRDSIWLVIFTSINMKFYIKVFKINNCDLEFLIEAHQVHQYAVLSIPNYAATIEI